MYFAASSPQDVLASGNTTAILALIAIVSWSVSVYLYKAYMKERDARLQDLKDFQGQAKEIADKAASKEEILYNKIEAARNGG